MRSLRSCALLMLLPSCTLFHPSEQTQAMVEASATLAQLHAELYSAMTATLNLLEAKNPGNAEITKVRVQLEVNRTNAQHVEQDLVRLIKSSSLDPALAQQLITTIAGFLPGAKP